MTPRQRPQRPSSIPPVATRHSETEATDVTQVPPRARVADRMREAIRRVASSVVDHGTWLVSRMAKHRKLMLTAALLAAAGGRAHTAPPPTYGATVYLVQSTDPSPRIAAARGRVTDVVVLSRAERSEEVQP